MRLISKLFLGFAAALLPSIAQTPDYFPLQVGNSWLYRAVQANPPNVISSEARTISVDGYESVQGREYFRVTYFGRIIYLRANTDGSIVSIVPGSAAEAPWLSLNLAEGASFTTSIDNCTRSGTIRSRKAEVSAPAGRYSDAVRVGFQTSCADAGFTEQFYVDKVGLVRHEETSIAGPRALELVYFRAGAGTATGPEVSFSLAIDSPRYKAGGEIAARLTLRSTLPEPIVLTFPSGQSYDLRIYNERGEVVYLWSEGRAFTLIYRGEERFGPGERTYGLAAPLRNLPVGRYIAQGYLTTNPRTYLAEASFEIVP